MPFYLRLILSFIIATALISCGRPAANSSKAPSVIGSSDSRRTTMPENSALKSRYLQSCYSCHHRGANSAPRTGSASDWAPRLAKGMDILLRNTTTGLNAMPPRGMCMDCSDDDYRALIKFMSGTSSQP